MSVITLFIASRLQFHFSLPFWILQVFFLNQLEKYLSFVSRWRQRDTGEKSTFLYSWMLASLLFFYHVSAAYEAASSFTSGDSRSTTPTDSFPVPLESASHGTLACQLWPVALLQTFYHSGPELHPLQCSLLGGCGEGILQILSFLGGYTLSPKESNYCLYFCILYCFM